MGRSGRLGRERRWLTLTGLITYTKTNAQESGREDDRALVA